METESLDSYFIDYKEYTDILDFSRDALQAGASFTQFNDDLFNTFIQLGSQR